MTVLHNIGQLATCPRDAPQQDAGLIDHATLVYEGSRIAWTGPEDKLPDAFDHHERIDCGGRLVIPGLIDCHTHLCFGGWRGDEFEQRLQGRTYQEIANAGGGIRSTVSATRAATTNELREKALDTLKEILSLGVTTLECKSGYGLEPVTELKQLEIYQQIDSMQAIDLVPTFLGAHMVPAEYQENRQAYIDLLCNDMIPEVAAKKLARFCDIFIEKGAYNTEEARQILSAAQDAGMGLKVHADQLSDGGGALFAAEMQATSAEHLEYASDEGIKALARSGTVAVSLPLASLYLNEAYLPARKMLQAGVRVAVATDFNPGSAPSFHLPLAMMLACVNQRMTPQEVLTGATTVAARALGMENHIGSLQPRFDADIAIIDAPNLNHWLYHFRANACAGVIKSGKWQQRSF